MDNNELNNDDDSMCSVSNIPTDTGINNSNAESMSMNENNNSDDDREDQGSFHTNNGMDQEPPKRVLANDEDTVEQLGN